MNPSSPYNSCNKRRQKQGLIGFALVTLVVLGITIALIVMGSENYNNGQELKENSTLEGCTITHLESNGDDCKGNQVIPEYTIISPDKCGSNITLSEAKGNEIGCINENDVKSMNDTDIDCYVNDKCDYYSFNEYSTLINSGEQNIIIGSAILGSVLFIWLLIGVSCIFIVCKNKYSAVNVEEDKDESKD